MILLFVLDVCVRVLGALLGLVPQVGIPGFLMPPGPSWQSPVAACTGSDDPWTLYCSASELGQIMRPLQGWLPVSEVTVLLPWLLAAFGTILAVAVIRKLIAHVPQVGGGGG